MTNLERVNGVLNDLVRINNDRVEGYEKAAEQIRKSNIDLNALFTRLAGESRSYSNELRDRIVRNGGEPATDTTVSGKIYRTWMDVKNMFTGSDRKSILESCEYGEDAAQKAYDEALETGADLDPETRQLIIKQKKALKASHNLVKQYRDMQLV